MIILVLVKRVSQIHYVLISLLKNKKQHNSNDEDNPDSSED